MDAVSWAINNVITKVVNALDSTPQQPGREELYRLREEPLIDPETKNEEEVGSDEDEMFQDNEKASLIDNSNRITPLPKGGILAVMLVFICEGFSYSFLFPFLGFMIMDLGVVSDSRKTGYYAGILAGSFALAQFFSGFLFGVLADRVSKKIVVLVSTVADAVSTIMFGFSRNFTVAVISRSLSGAFNGNIATAKAYLSDITDSSNQSFAFSLIALAWGIGCIGGPVIGGFLSNPATKYPRVFGYQLFFKFPYLLPCLVSALVMLLEFIGCALFMNHVEKPKHNQESAGLFVTSSSDSKAKNIVKYIWFEIKEMVSIITNREVAVAVAIYCIANGVDAFQEELFPLWSMLKVGDGGLSFTTTEIGIVQMIIGVLLLPQTLVFPIMAKFLGKLNSMRIGFLFMLPLVFTPQISLAIGNRALLWISLVVFSVFRALTIAMTFTAVLIIVNNSAPVGAIGRVMSYSNSLSCIARTIAPFVAGPLMAVSAHYVSFNPLYINLPFVFFSLFSIGALAISFVLDDSINNPKN